MDQHGTRIYEATLRIEVEGDVDAKEIERQIYSEMENARFAFDVDKVDRKYSTLAEVDQLAEQLHQGQFDKIGVPYIEHVRAVAAGLKPFGLELQMAGLLHDTIEDTGWTGEKLRKAGVQSRVVDIVEVVTNDYPRMTYSQTLKRITGNRQATLLKIADNAHNSHPDRQAGLSDADRTRLRRKYWHARLKLWPTVDREDVQQILEIVNPSLLPDLADFEERS